MSESRVDNKSQIIARNKVYTIIQRAIDYVDVQQQNRLTIHQIGEVLTLLRVFDLIYQDIIPENQSKKVNYKAS